MQQRQEIKKVYDAAKALGHIYPIRPAIKKAVEDKKAKDNGN